MARAVTTRGQVRGWGGGFVFALVLAGCGSPKEADPPAGGNPSDPADPSEPSDPQDEPIDADGDGFLASVDCDDADPEVHARVTVNGDQAYGDLPTALAAAPAGAEVRVCAGTYTGELVATVAVNLVSDDGADATHLSGGGATRVLALPGGSSVTGFTIEGGRNDDGAGILQTSPEPLVIADCIVTGNEARRGGGIAGAEGGVLVLRGTVVSGNTAEGGGGVNVRAGGRLELEDSTISDNSAVHWGGGVHLDGAELVGGVVSGNRTTQEWWGEEVPRGGGGVSSVGTSAITGTRIEDNESLEGGGFSLVSGTLTLTDTTVDGNRAVDLPGASGQGGGGLVQSGTLVLVQSGVTGNASSSSGGGLELHDARVEGGTVDANTAESGGGISMSDSALVGVTISGNVATNNGGGGINASGDEEIVGCTISENDGGLDDGGGIRSSSFGVVYLTDTRVVDNRASRGGGIWSAVLDVTGGEISGNTAEEGAGVFLTYIEDGSLGDAYVFRGVRVARNVATVRGGGVAMNDLASSEAGGTLVSDGSDWGTGADDNLPGDVSYVWYGPGESPDEASYGADASFSCTDEGCQP